MSSDSSEEDLALIKEAQDTYFLKENLYNKVQGGEKKLEPNIKPLSLRRTVDENEQFNFLRVTPEFQQYVAKHLSLILDNQLKKTLDYDVKDRTQRKKKRTSGVKLFFNSEKLLKVSKEGELPPVLLRNKPVKKFTVKHSIPVNEEDLKNIAVSGEHILLKKDIKHWSNRTKSKKIFHYKQDQNGKLQLVESTFK